jgi:hypothetical protein
MTYPFKDYFKGFEKIKIIRKVFGKKTNEVLHDLKVEFIGWGGYMLVSDIDGHIIISADYLKKGNIIDIYLDVIHELVHVKQFMKGKKLFDERFNYTERPTEIEAYRYAVDEARRLGLDDKRICEYLKTEWMSMKDFKRLAKALNVKCIQRGKKP